MATELAELAAQGLWPVLLELRQFLSSARALEVEQIGLAFQRDQWTLLGSRAANEQAAKTGSLRLLIPLSDSDSLDSEAVAVYSQHAFRTGGSPLLGKASQLGTSERAFLRAYLPMILGSFFARQAGELFITAHVAQTLDGRIACLNGHSQWISNHANLVHAHRIRALHDVVLVGRGTVESDDPALTVRHVSGPHPRRVLLTSDERFLSADCADYQVFREHGCLILTSHDRSAKFAASSDFPDEVEVVGVEYKSDGSITRSVLQRELIRRRLHSVFIEGGSVTVSRFFDQRSLDLLHLHLAPVILGSGVSSFCLPEVLHIESARRMLMEHFLLDGELLIECRDAAPKRRVGEPDASGLQA